MAPASGTVLIVDDNDSVRTLLARMVAAVGYRAELAADGAEGVAAFSARRGAFTAVLLDAMMPVMDGAEALRRFRELNPRTPVICISGHAREDLEVFFGECQPDMFVAKPCTMQQINAAIAAFVPPSSRPMRAAG